MQPAGDELCPPEVFVLQIDCQSPHYAHFRRAVYAPRTWPAIEAFPAHIQLDPTLLWAHYRLTDDFLDARDIPWDPDCINLVIVQGLRYRSNAVETPYEPVGW